MSLGELNVKEIKIKKKKERHLQSLFSVWCFKDFCLIEVMMLSQKKKSSQQKEIYFYYS